MGDARGASGMHAFNCLLDQSGPQSRPRRFA